MPEYSISAMPEIFVSDTAISKVVSEAVARGQLRKLGSRLYTRNLEEVKWSTKSGHQVKAVKCHNEVNHDKRNEQETVLHGRLQTRRGDAGYGPGLQDFRGGPKSGYWG